MGTLFLFETLTAGTFSSRGARTLSDEHVRPCVIILHLITKGRGHGWRGGIKMFPRCCRIGRDVSVSAKAPWPRRTAGHMLRPLVDIDGPSLDEVASVARVTLILPI